jgi:phosphoribosylanthranilate isomerase
MIAGVTVKVCGLTRAEDARLAAELGADYLGFIFYPKSPRAISRAAYAAMKNELPVGPKRVAVLVEPTLAELSAALAAGFDRFQIHARLEVETAVISGWSAAVGAERLWLAPKLPPGGTLPEAWLGAAETFLMDTFHAEGFGGSGRTGDWRGFAERANRYSTKSWILAGGLGPENIAAAVAASGARFVDVNSGVESAPGIKSEAKLRALAKSLATRAE